MAKTNYYYIDETGHINNDSTLFVYGCIKSDTPQLLEKALEELKKTLEDDILLAKYGERVRKNNFHATADHISVITEMFRLLPHLNFRAYFTVLLKSGAYYENLKATKDDNEIIELMLKKTVLPRLKAKKEEKHTFFFEELEVEKRSLKTILDTLFNEQNKVNSVIHHIVGKENPNMPVTDYMSYILNKILSSDNKDIENWMKNNFDVIKDKIALIHFLNDDSFLSRKGNVNNTITYKNLRKKLTVV